jgi:hypothetical protein
MVGAGRGRTPLKVQHLLSRPVQDRLDVLSRQPGLFDGEHRFAVEPLEGGRFRFVQEERFRGLLVPLFAKGLDTHTRAGFEAMYQALKARAGGRAAAP